MKKRTVEIKETKEYIGKRLVSRWKTTSISWKENGTLYIHSYQDPKNFQSVYFSKGDDIDF